jgi:hypothetical protein
VDMVLMSWTPRSSERLPLLAALPRPVRSVDIPVTGQHMGLGSLNDCLNRLIVATRCHLPRVSVQIDYPFEFSSLKTIITGSHEGGGSRY